MSTLSQDFRYAFRTLVKNPGFTVVAILTLALGIAANTAIFSALNALFLHPAGIPDPGRLLAIRVKYDKLNLKSIVISATDFADVRDSKKVFSSAAMMDQSDFTYSASGFPERLQGARVTWQWFETFGAKPFLGRTFHLEEDLPNANNVVVISYGTWRPRFAGFGGDGTIVGKTIQLNQQPFKVIGVMGPEFDWPNQARLWVPLGLPPSEYGPENRFNENYFAVARIAPGVSIAQAQAFIKLRAAQAVESIPDAARYAKDSQWGVFALPFPEFVFGDLKTPILILLGAVAFVLLIACTNIAGLLLARASGRGKELAVRAALGASRWHLIRLTLAESLVLGGVGTGLGLAMAQGGIQVLEKLAPRQGSGMVIRTDAYVLAFTIVAGIISALLFGIAPAWQVSTVHKFEALKEGGRSGMAGVVQHRLRAVLVAGEVALALVLLVGAGLFLKSLGKLGQLDPGFDARGLMTAALSNLESHNAVYFAAQNATQQIAFYRQVTERLATVPGVQSAAAVYPLPFSGESASSSFAIEGRPLGPGDPGPHSDLQWVTPDYFSVMRIPVGAGRVFTSQDREGAPPVVVIDENLARQYWPNADPIGKRLRREGAWRTIIGVVGHTDRSALVGETGKGVSYYPIFQTGIPSAYLVARTTVNPSTLATPIREVVRAVNPDLPVYDLLTEEERVAASLGPRRFGATLLSFFAGVALLMAAIGLYGIVSYSVTQRTQEFGIRMALGAEGRQVLTLVVKQGMRLVAYGALAGLIIAFALARLLSSQLFAVGAFDPMVFLLTAFALSAIAVVACYIPARRATRVDPMVALRYE